MHTRGCGSPCALHGAGALPRPAGGRETIDATSQGSAARKSRILTLASHEEEAAVWDAHDFTEFDDEFEPIEYKVDGDVSLGLVLPHDLVDHDIWAAIDAQPRA